MLSSEANTAATNMQIYWWIYISSINGCNPAALCIFPLGDSMVFFIKVKANIKKEHHQGTEKTAWKARSDETKCPSSDATASHSGQANFSPHLQSGILQSNIIFSKLLSLMWWKLQLENGLSQV